MFLLFWFNALLLTHFENLTIVPQQNVSEKKVTSSNILNLGYLSEKWNTGTELCSKFKQVYSKLRIYSYPLKKHFFRILKGDVLSAIILYFALSLKDENLVEEILLRTKYDIKPAAMKKETIENVEKEVT